MKRPAHFWLFSFVCAGDGRRQRSPGIVSPTVIGRVPDLSFLSAARRVQPFAAGHFSREQAIILNRQSWGQLDLSVGHHYVGGADHKVGQDEHPEHRYDEIEQWVRERFPIALDVIDRWSGEMMGPSDDPAYLGRNPMDDKHVYIITGIPAIA